MSDTTGSIVIEEEPHETPVVEFVPTASVPGQGRWRFRLEIAGFLAPAALIYAVFVLVPVGMAMFYSVFDWNGLEPLDNFVGLGNFKEAFSDPVFITAIKNCFIIVILSILIQGPIAISLALLLNRPMRGRGALRLIFFAPYVLSEVITAVMWLLLLQPDGGVDQFMQAIGLGDFTQLWLADRNIVLYTLFVVITWKYIGFAIILFLAGLQAIPQELLEAASIDGASYWKLQRHIVLPLLGPTIRIWAFLSIIGALQLFDLIYIMTLGGPANASMTMVIYIQQHGFVRSEYGYGSAVAVILFAICFAFALLYQRFVLRRDTEGALTRGTA